VAFLAPNLPELLAAHFAVLQVRATLVAINTRLDSGEVGYILNHSGAVVALVDPELSSRVAEAPDGLEAAPTLVNLEDPVAGVTGTPLDGPSFDEFVDGAEVLPIRGEIDDEQRLTSINYTSGTTGRPKGVMYTHRGALLNALGEIIVHELERDSVFLWTLPLFHCNGWCFPWAVTGAGGTHVMLRAIDPPKVLQLIGEHGVTHFNGAPTVLLMLAQDPGAEGLRFDPEVRVATGGAPPSPTLLARMEDMGIRVTHLYGLTETYGPHVYCAMQPGWEALDVEGRARVMARQGVPYHTATHLRVVDDEMRDVPPDGESMGEVVMRGNNVMRGYYRDPEGENISTIEVEHTIAKHPAVLECAVVAAPDEKWGEVPKAFVSLRPGARVEEPELIDFCREHLAHFKCPKAVEFTELPKTSTGKIQKFVLREKEWAGREKRIH
jgi:fatty-acyl-CoA synthase